MTARGSQPGRPAIAAVAGRLERLMWTRSRRMLATWMERPVSMPQLHVLAELYPDHRLTLGGLADRLGISAPSATQLVDRLEEHAMVVRARDHTDRRRVEIVLTAAGRARVDEMAGVHRDRIGSMLERLDDDDLEDLVRILDRVAMVTVDLGEMPANDPHRHGPPLDPAAATDVEAAPRSSG